MYDLQKTRNSEWIDSDLGQILVQLCDKGGNSSILIVWGDIYIHNVELFDVCPFLLFSF